MRPALKWLSFCFVLTYFVCLWVCVCVFLPLARVEPCALASLPLAAACLKAKDSSQRSVRNEKLPRAVWQHASHIKSELAAERARNQM